MKRETVLLRTIRRCCTDAFGEQLTGIYLHSHWPWADFAGKQAMWIFLWRYAVLLLGRRRNV